MKRSRTFNFRGDTVVMEEVGAYKSGAPAYALVGVFDGSPMAKVTVNVPEIEGTLQNWCHEEGLERGHVLIVKTWSENEGIPELLELEGLIRLTGMTIRVGYAVARIATLVEDAFK